MASCRNNGHDVSRENSDPRGGTKVRTVTGIFSSQNDAERAASVLGAAGVSTDKLILLTPGKIEQELEHVPVDNAEQPGMGKAVGAVLGAAGGLSAGTLLTAALIPGVGPVTAIGLLGGAILAAAGGAVGAAAGGSIENSQTHGLPEDEIFVYEDALRRGKSVVIAFTEEESEARRLHDLLATEGAEQVDAARQQWWIGLRSAEHEHYTASGKDFGADEEYYRRGFEDALHARTRCKEFDQVSAEMDSRLEDLERQHPGEKIAEAYTRGYQRGREYYQHFCDEKMAA
jgi:hypothetical protein